MSGSEVLELRGADQQMAYVIKVEILHREQRARIVRKWRCGRLAEFEVCGGRVALRAIAVIVLALSSQLVSFSAFSKLR